MSKPPATNTRGGCKNRSRGAAARVPNRAARTAPYRIEFDTGIGPLQDPVVEPVTDASRYRETAVEGDMVAPQRYRDDQPTQNQGEHHPSTAEEDDKDGEHQVVVLLDSKRPKYGERVVQSVRHADVGAIPRVVIREVEHAGRYLPGRERPTQRREGQAADRQQHEQSRIEPQQPADIELTERQLPDGGLFGQDLARDQEAADEKEYRNPEPTRNKVFQPGMTGHDQSDRSCAQAVERRDILEGRCRRVCRGNAAALPQPRPILCIQRYDLALSRLRHSGPLISHDGCCNDPLLDHTRSL